jgi:hypothetical protein
VPMSPRFRKLALTAHVTSSVGWLGAVVAYLPLGIIGLTSDDPQLVRAVYLSVVVVAGFVIVPFAIAALGTGLVQSLGTDWGLFRHYWVATKFVLTVGAVAILLGHMQTIRDVSVKAAATSFVAEDLGRVRLQLLVHAVGGLVVLIAATVLSVFKPWGRTPYGVRKQRERLGNASKHE